METVEDISEGGYMVSYPDLKECIICTDTMEAVITDVEDAELTWLKVALEPV